MAGGGFQAMPKKPLACSFACVVHVGTTKPGLHTRCATSSLSWRSAAHTPVQPLSRHWLSDNLSAVQPIPPSCIVMVLVHTQQRSLSLFWLNVFGHQGTSNVSCYLLTAPWELVVNQQM